MIHANVKAATAKDEYTFNIVVDQKNYNLILKLLERERENIVNKLKEYNKAGLIKSISYPRNKHIQKELDSLVKRKQIIKNSTEQIIRIFKKL